MFINLNSLQKKSRAHVFVCIERQKTLDVIDFHQIGELSGITESGLQDITALTNKTVYIPARGIYNVYGKIAVEFPNKKHLAENIRGSTYRSLCRTKTTQTTILHSDERDKKTANLCLIFRMFGSTKGLGQNR